MAGWGGKRDGAGRKPKKIKFPVQVSAMDEKFATQLEKCTENVIKLANGGYLRETKVWKAAGLVQKVETQRVETDSGPKILRHLVPAFPGVEDTKLVCVEVRREKAEPDLAANKFIIERIGGATGALDDAEPESADGAEVNEETRAQALERMQEWRTKSAEQLASIRNPVTGQSMAQSEASESTSAENTSRDSSTMEEF